VPWILFETIPLAPRRQAYEHGRAIIREHGRAVLGDVFVEQDARLGVAQQSRQPGLAEKRTTARILSIKLGTGLAALDCTSE
jgi:hypothetical protein